MKCTGGELRAGREQDRVSPRRRQLLIPNAPAMFLQRLPVVLFSSQLLAQIVVGPGGFPTINAGIQAAPPGGTVTVAPGTYNGPIDFGGRAITLISATPLGATIVGTGGSTVRFVSGETSSSVLEGFVVTGGNAPLGGGILCIGTSPTLRNNRIVNNSALGGLGGGLYVQDGAPMLQNNHFEANLAAEGGGIYALRSSPTIVRCRLTSNSVTIDGGGAVLATCRATIVDTEFVRNIANRDGGGLLLSASEPVQLSGASFTENRANADGGGMAALGCGGSGVEVGNSSFTDNLAVGEGGGMHAFETALTVRESRFSRNYADTFGGAIDVAGDAVVTIEGCVVEKLNSAGISGGGIAVRDGCSAAIRRNLIENSLANIAGGGIYINSATAQMDANQLLGNGRAGTNPTIPATQPTQVTACENGGGLAIESAATDVTFTNGIIEDNFATLKGGGVYAFDSRIAIRSNEISRNGGDLSQGATAFTTQGGGLFVDGGRLRIEANQVLRNQAAEGGGLHLQDVLAGRLVNNVIAKNWARGDATGAGVGGGVSLEQVAIQFLHNTVAQNTTQSPIGFGFGGGSAVFVKSGPGPTIWNSILRGIGTLVDANPGSAPTVTHCNHGPNIGGNWNGGGGNFDLLPQYIDAANDNFRLQLTSPCRDAGTLPVNPALPPFDIDLQPRVQGGVPDIGADEVG
jgi:hypothetical protein